MSDIRKRIIKEDDDFDVKKIISRILDHWKLYVISLVTFIVAGFLFIRYSTPLYRAHAQVLVQDEQNDGSSSFLQSSALADFSNLFNVKSNVNNELAILQTPDLLQRVVEEMNLNIDYFRKGRIRSVELYDQSPFKVDFIPVSDSVSFTAFNINFPNSEPTNKFS